jgi:hypothetical protein
LIADDFLRFRLISMKICQSPFVWTLRSQSLTPRREIHSHVSIQTSSVFILQSPS